MEMELGKLFIGGISWDTNEERLREYFHSFGEVVQAVIMKDRATGRARGFGFVVFADPTIAERVVMEKHMIDGRTVEAKKALPRDDRNILLNKTNSSIHGSSPGPARTKKIFVGGLASTVTESDFKGYFEQFGTITNVVVMYDHNTQRPRGFGFITYDSEEVVDNVLQRTFHVLNGKMVEVKRAVPKELSPGPSQNQLGGGYNFGPSMVNSFLNGYMQNYNAGSVGGYGARPEGRFSPVTIGRNGFPPMSSGYGMGLNLESNLSPNYGGSSNLSMNLGYGRGLNMNTTSFNGKPDEFASLLGYVGGANGGNSSISNLAGRNSFGNGSLNYAANPTNSSSVIGSGVSSLGNIGSLWDSSPTSGQGGGASFAYNDGDFRSGGIGYERKNGAAGVAHVSSSYGPLKGGYNGAYVDIDENGPFYGDSTWFSSPLDLQRSGSFGFGLGNITSNVRTNSTASGHIGGYAVPNLQSDRGIVA